MNRHIRSLLLPFYFGSIENEDRIAVERELLIDSELLLDYLDLKRQLESAQSLSDGPSERVWKNLQKQLRPKRKFLVPLSVGAAIAASVLFVYLFYFTHPQEAVSVSHSTTEILFDSRHELSADSGVL